MVVRWIGPVVHTEEIPTDGARAAFKVVFAEPALAAETVSLPLVCAPQSEWSLTKTRILKVILTKTLHQRTRILVAR